ncbi:hypothetical protein ACG2F4_10300 [Halalkalibaculum sp. DA3122]|uniref:5-methylcytosine restriction system specificity protein McrC n=1 Tax=Halalkalibaculum sp. DA3122 TaxID=3373607 RepID=UPI0037550793
MKQVPVQNIYYLLSYAWDKLDEAELTKAGIDDFEEIANLLGKVLANGCSFLFKRGLYRNYRQKEEEIPGIRGKLLINESISGLSFQNRKAWCQFDELSHNVLPNRILKSTVRRLLQMDEIENSLHLELKELYYRFSDVEEVLLELHHFTKVQIHRNNAFYGFLIQICRLIFESSALDESGQKYQFRDFTRDHQKLARLFEAFVFNFYRKEQDRYKVKSPSFSWPFKSTIEAHNELLPSMFTDIVLEDDERIIIIDTKFYSKTMARREDLGSISFKSPNMYQIFAYMQHIPNPKNKKIEGMLLYPDVGDTIHATYTLNKQILTFKTVDLDQEWKKIENELMDLLDLLQVNAV